MLAEITLQMAELRRSDLLADAGDHRATRTSAMPAIAARLRTALPRRRTLIDDPTLAPASCCAAPA